MEDLVAPSSAFWCNKKVLVTGHTGFKGSWLTAWLLKMGANVTGLSLKPKGENSLFNVLGLEDKIQHHLVDIREVDKVFSVLEGTQPEIVFHLAAQALVLPSYENPIETYSTNVMGTLHLYEACRVVCRPQVIVNVTSDKCYENKEWPWAYRENEPMGGFDPYSSSKGCSEILTASYRQSFFKKTSTQLASVRAGNVIGGGDWSYARLIPDIIMALKDQRAPIIRNPQSIRPWQHVLEPLSGYLAVAEKAFENKGEFDQAWNFGPNESDTLTVRQITEVIGRIWGENAEFQYGNSGHNPHEAHFLKLDSSKAKTYLEWKPRLGIEKALTWTVNWYKSWLKGENMMEFTNAQIDNYIRNKHL